MIGKIVNEIDNELTSFYLNNFGKPLVTITMTPKIYELVRYEDRDEQRFMDGRNKTPTFMGWPIVIQPEMEGEYTIRVAKA